MRDVTGQRVEVGTPVYADLAEENVALRVAWEMERRGWSQERMAREMTDAGCPLHQSAISKIVNPRADGTRRSITMDEAIAFASVFGIPLGELAAPLVVAKGREIHQLAEAISENSVHALREIASLMLTWSRLKYRLKDSEAREMYIGLLQRMHTNETRASDITTIWEDPALWGLLEGSFSQLHHVQRFVGGNRYLTGEPDWSDRYLGRNEISRLVELREFFRHLSSISKRISVRHEANRVAPILVACGLLEVAAPPLDFMLRGEPDKLDVVPALSAIEARLTELASGDGEPVERLAAQIALIWDSRNPTLSELVTETGRSVEEVTTAIHFAGPRSHRDQAFKRALSRVLGE